MQKKQTGRFEKKRTPGKGRKVALILGIVLLVLVVGAITAVQLLFVPAGGTLILRSSTEADLRGREVSVEEYRALTEELPGCHILWDIPIGGTTYDSTAAQIVLEAVTAEEAELFLLFDDLQRIDATQAVCYEELVLLEELLPDCVIDWAVHLGTEAYSPAEAQLDLTGTGIESGELMEKLPLFEGLTQVTIRDSGYSAEEQTALKEAFPGIRFSLDVEVAGKVWLSTDTVLDYAGQQVDVQSLINEASRFDAVEKIDLQGCGCTLDELLAVKEAYPEAMVLAEVALFDKEFLTDAETLDFSGIPMEDTSAIARIMPLMGNLTKVDMCDCGISNEEMDALNKQFENTQFVWMVHFSVYSLRTDATQFCASNLPEYNFVAPRLTDKGLEPIKYCENLIALDLGHMVYTDLSFLENMPHLKYLILVEARFTDITPIGTLKELEYLELFVNTIDDLSPLLECKSLKYLNIGYTSGFDPDVLKEMTWLEKLWFPGHLQSDERIESIIASLPNTECYMPAYDADGSTGGGWREQEAYYEMRDIFSMYYLPGGTGMGDDD